MPRKASVWLGVYCALVASWVLPAKAKPNWTQEGASALKSRSLLARCGAMLALRDYALQHPDDVLRLYAGEANFEQRRRLALVLGEASVRLELERRAVRRRPSLEAAFKQFEREVVAAREVSVAYWVDYANLDTSAAVREQDRLNEQNARAGARLSWSAQNVLNTLRSSRASEPLQREEQLLRWCVQVAVVGSVRREVAVPVWDKADPLERTQSLQMFQLVKAPESPPRAAPPELEADDNWAYVPVLSQMACGWFRPNRFGLDGEKPALQLRAQAPLLRVQTFRADHLYLRSWLARLGDRSALEGLSEVKGDDTSNGHPNGTAAIIRARLGDLEGLHELWKIGAIETISQRLDVGLGPFPKSYLPGFSRWLSPEDQKALKEFEEQRGRSRSLSELGSDAWKPFWELTRRAQTNYGHELKAVFERELPRLKWSPITQKFFSPNQAQTNPLAPISSVPAPMSDTGAEDDAARAWYEACARRVFDRDLSVSVGAVRAILWGEAASAQALEREAKRSPSARAARLQSLRRLVPDGTFSIRRAQPDEFTSTVLRFVLSNDADTTIAQWNTMTRLFKREDVPLVVAFAEWNPRLWRFLATEQVEEARFFLAREVAREKNGNYILGDLGDLFDAFVFYQIVEAVPLLKRGPNNWWRREDNIVYVLGELGDAETIQHLRSQLGRPNPPYPEATTRTVQIVLARNGDVSLLDECVEALRNEDFNTPRRAVRALRACLPFRGPMFSPDDRYPSQEEVEQVYSAWRDWLAKNRDRLKWNPVLRRYTLN